MTGWMRSNGRPSPSRATPGLQRRRHGCRLVGRRRGPLPTAPGAGRQNCGAARQSYERAGRPGYRGGTSSESASAATGAAGTVKTRRSESCSRGHGSVTSARGRHAGAGADGAALRHRHAPGVEPGHVSDADAPTTAHQPLPPAPQGSSSASPPGGGAVKADEVMDTLCPDGLLPFDEGRGTGAPRPGPATETVVPGRPSPRGGPGRAVGILSVSRTAAAPQLASSRGSLTGDGAGR